MTDSSDTDPRAAHGNLSQSLVRRESELRAVLYSIADGVITTDTGGRIQRMNPEAERLTGWRETEARGRMLEEVFHILNEETRAPVEDPARKVLREGTVVGLANHTLLIARDGTERPIADAGAPVRNEAGQIVGVVLVFRDQSAERAARRKIEAARSLAEGILATLREPLLVLDAGLRVMKANHAFYQTFQTTPGETEGRPIYELGNRQWDLPELRKLLECILPQNSHFDDFEVEHDFPHLGRRIMRLNARRLHRDGKKTALILLAIEDVTGQRETETALRIANDHLNLLLEETPAVIYTCRPDGEYGATYISPNVLRQTGYSAEEFTSNPAFWATHIHPEDKPRVFAGLEEGLFRHDQHVHEYRFRHQDGSWRWMHDELRLLRDEHGHPKEIVGYRVDITERRQAEERARLAASVFEYSVEGIFITDIEGKILLANNALCTITGYDQEELVGKNPRIFHSGRHDSAFFHDMFARLEAEGYWQGEVFNRRKSGVVFPSWMTIALVPGDHGSGGHYIGVMLDLSEHKAQEERIERLAFYDPLTGLPNRALFIDRLRQALAGVARHGLSLALIFLDLDDFKSINDTHGHDVGDEFLAGLAQRLQATLRQEETLARFGGDEFYVFASAAGEETAVQIAERLQQACRQPQRVNGIELMSEVSIGIALFPDDGQSPEELFKAADIAMYRAKEAGGGYRFYDREMGAEVARRVELSSRLRLALKEDRLMLHYQPVVELGSGVLAGAEALIRWQDPEWGWVSPAEFIPVAEERGLIQAVGEWVVREGCRQLRTWAQAGHPLPGRLAINVSGRQFHQPDFGEQLLMQVNAADLGPGNLELEITETTLIDTNDIEAVARRLLSLRSEGFAFAIDDFGTGYSSLRYLKHLRVDKLKIDQSFVRTMLEDENDHAIVCAVIALADVAHAATLAEGVEHRDQADALHALGCRYGQGFYFGHPCAADEFAARWLHAQP